MSVRAVRVTSVMLWFFLSFSGCTHESSAPNVDGEAYGAPALLAAAVGGEDEEGSSRSYASKPVLEVLLLTVEGSEANHLSWQEALGEYGISITPHTALAGVRPSERDLQTLAEDFDVALVTGPGAASAYGAGEWNDLGIGLVTTEALLANETRWQWLDVGSAEPRRRRVHQLKVEDPHSVLYGLSVGDGGKIEAMPAAGEGVVLGYGRRSQGTTDMGFVALSFGGDDEDEDVFQQFVLWEPGAFYSGGEGRAASRRALFGVECGEGSELSAPGKQLLRQTLEWASRKGEPKRQNPSFNPVGLLLTWQRDPTSTMTIDWHTLASEPDRGSRVRYWADGTEQKERALGRSHAFPFSDRVIHRVELEGLEPDTLYLFDFGEDSRVFRFRTMPSRLEGPLHFITGGDVRHTMEMMMQTSMEAHRHSPAFIAWGGDIAYDDGKAESAPLWYEWFEVMKTSLINGEGRVIPVIVAIGNHEVLGGYYSEHSGYRPTDAWRRELAPFFYGLFAFPGQPGYDVLDFGDYMSWVVLDTDHTNPIVGAQALWLSEVLRFRQRVPHVFPLYHVPAYPSVRDFTSYPRSAEEIVPWLAGSWHRGAFGDNRPRRVRENFVPLFEAYGVRTAFENHDHTYKRTHPLRGGGVDSEGIVYLGDGAWGVRTRVPRTPAQEWYLAKSRGARHFIVGTIEGEHQKFRAFDEHGRLFDAVAR